MEPKTAIDPRSLLEHRNFVRGIVRGLLADEHAVDDVVQETCLRALERPPRHAMLRAWLGRVGRNLALSVLRGERRRGHREREAARPEQEPSAGDAAARLERHRLVVEAVLALEEPFRSAILLRFYEDLPPREIARQLGVPVDTVRSRVRRGLERLRAWFDARHGGDRSAWSLALLPLLGAREAAAMVAASGATATATATSGGAKVLLAEGTVMSMKAKIVGAALVVCALGTGTVAWQVARTRDVPPPPRAVTARDVAPPEEREGSALGTAGGDAVVGTSPGSLPDRGTGPAQAERSVTTVNAEFKIGREPSPKPAPKPYRLAEPCGEADLGALRVIVTDGGGSPLGAAKVTAGIIKGYDLKTTNYESDAGGRLELRSLEPGKWQVSAKSLSQHRIATVEVEAGRFTEVAITLAGGATVEGQVRHVERGPLGGLFLRINREVDGFSDYFSATTDAQGRYRLEGVLPGTYPVHLQGKPVGFETRALATIEIPAAGTVTRDILLGRITLRGTVRDADTGAPIPGVRIRFQSGWWGEVTTDRDGVYALPDLQTGNYKVVLTRDGYGTEFGETGLVPEGGTLTTDFTLRQAAVLVLEILDRDGRPISGRVQLGLSAIIDHRQQRVSDAGSLGTSVDTDPRGVACYPRIVPGLYDIAVGTKGYVRTTQRVDVKAGENRVTFRLDPDRAAPPDKVSLQGAVRDAETGRPIAGVRVSVQRMPVFKEARSAGDGAYRLCDVPPGKWTVIVERDGYGVRFIRDVEVGNDPRTLDVDLSPAATLHIHVTDGSGRPVAGSLHVGIQGREEGLTNVGTGVDADAEGHAVYKQIVPGTYDLRIVKEGVGEGKVEAVIALGENVVRVRLE
ncbi:MAG: sigma-70 family RNA polymerase sigma factor [Planctomycetes bacterium]|nr:sigma-70 family RNA polymerase sigma factor [Planctomycetota bacterium]